MGKPTGFLEHTRSPIPDRAPLDRVKDWDEIHEDFQEEKSERAGLTLHGLWNTILPHGHDYQ